VEASSISPSSGAGRFIPLDVGDSGFAGAGVVVGVDCASVAFTAIHQMSAQGKLVGMTYH